MALQSLHFQFQLHSGRPPDTVVPWVHFQLLQHRPSATAPQAVAIFPVHATIEAKEVDTSTCKMGWVKKRGKITLEDLNNLTIYRSTMINL